MWLPWVVDICLKGIGTSGGRLEGKPWVVSRSS
jgi:hypothetical protein